MIRTVANRALQYATLASFILFVVAVLLFIAGFAVNPWDHRLSVTENFHIGVWRYGSGLDVRLVFFNHGEYGPYRGGAIAVIDDQGNVHPPRERESAWGDSWGIYWRYFHWKEAWGQTDPVLWTLMVSLWYPMVLFSLLPVLSWWLRDRRRSGFRVT